jgi:hypothetical protein
MATLRATANVNANNLTTQQSLSTQIISSLTVTQGGILVDNITELMGGPKTLLTAADYAEGTKVYLRNKNSDTVDLFISYEAAGNTGEGSWTRLKAGEWAFFPWFANANLRVYASANTGCILEYGVFE